MKYNKIVSILTMAVILSFIITIAVPPTQASAQSITVSPVFGFRGAKITITGTGFDSYANDNVYLYFGDEELKSIEVADNGTLSSDFHVPSYAKPGTSHSVTIQNEGGVTLAETWFIVGAKIDLNPEEAKIGTGIQIGGRYFDADEEVRLYFSSDNANLGDNIDAEVTAYEYIGAATTDTAGNFIESLSYIIPLTLTDGDDWKDVQIGDNYIYATYLSDVTRIKAVARFPVISDVQLEPLTLSPSSGPQGSKVTVTGTDLDSYANNYVYLYFADNKLEDVKVADNGTFTTEFHVPTYASPGTSYPVTVLNDNDDLLAEASFTVGAKLELSLDSGEINNMVQIGGRCFDANKEISLYFSSDNANVGDSIDSEVTAYKYLGLAYISTDGYFENPWHFTIPKELADGEKHKYVNSGEYYVYAAYYSGGKVIAAWTTFMVIGVVLYPEEGPVGTIVKMSSEELGDKQELTIEFDGHEIELTSSGNETTDNNPNTCFITIPDSTVGGHLINITNEHGKKSQAVFTVQPRITISPNTAEAGDEVKFSGSGFEAPYFPSDYITITLHGDNVTTEPPLIRASSTGSFDGTFVIPPDFTSYTVINKVAAIDSSLNTAEAELSIITIETGISLSPSTSLTSPGYAGMDITANCTGFIANTPITITYGSDEAITVASATTDADGNYSVTFSAPPSSGGEHTITGTDGTNTATSVFFMESVAPLKPAPLGPEITNIEESTAHFDWEDVEDVSGVTYTFQIASDTNFNKIVLEEKGLTSSEYILNTGATPTSYKENTPYYWRVKAVDGALNESEGTLARLLYIGKPPSSGSGEGFGKWTWMIAIGLGAVAFIILILALRPMRKYR